MARVGLCIYVNVDRENTGKIWLKNALVKYAGITFTCDMYFSGVPNEYIYKNTFLSVRINV